MCVSDKGLLTAKGPGAAKLTVTTEDGKQASLDFASRRTEAL